MNLYLKYFSPILLDIFCALSVIDSYTLDVSYDFFFDFLMFVFYLKVYKLF